MLRRARHVPWMVGLLGLVSLGCATAPGMFDARLPDSPKGLQELMGQAREIGFQCKLSDSGKSAVCKHAKFFNQFFELKADPPRLIHSSTFGFKDQAGCRDAAPQLMKINQGYNIGVFYCLDQTLIIRNAFPLPKRGFDSDELVAYFKWWGPAILRTLTTENMNDYLN